jgi:glutathione S-transferase
MILVGQFDSPYVRRVGISLLMLDLSYERDRRSVYADADAMRTINPLGRIPSLILDDGEVLIDSNAILDHLDELAGPERALIPPRGAPRRRALRTIALATGAIDKAGTITAELALRPPDKQYAPWLDRCRTQLATTLAALEAETGPTWHGGDRPMQADITIASMIGYLRLRLRDAFPAGAYPALARLADACEALPSFERTRPADDEQMPRGL